MEKPNFQNKERGKGWKRLFLKRKPMVRYKSEFFMYLGL